MEAIKDRPSNLHFGEQRCAELLAELGASDESYFYSTEDTQLWAVAADLLVAVDSNYSVEAMLAGTPTINLLNIGGMLLGLSFEAESGVVEVEAHELAAAIQRLLSDAPFRARQLENMRLRAPYYNLGVDGKAAQRVASLMQELAAGRFEEKSAGVWQEYLDVEHTDVEAVYHDTARSPLIDVSLSRRSSSWIMAARLGPTVSCSNSAFRGQGVGAGNQPERSAASCHQAWIGCWLAA